MSYVEVKENVVSGDLDIVFHERSHLLEIFLQFLIKFPFLYTVVHRDMGS